MRAWNGIRVGILGAVAGMMLALPGVAAAETYNVTTTADGDDKECVIDCTLREATVLGGSDDTINVPPGTYVIDGELFLSADTIVGASARTTIIDAGNKSRVIQTGDGTTRISGVTIRNGSVASTDAGGGIFVQSGTLILQNATVSGNTAGTGGGIATAGIAQIIGSTISGNTANALRLSRGGGIATGSNGGLLLGNSTVSGNTATNTGSAGGGIHSTGTLAIIASTIAANAASVGGGIHVTPPPSGAATQVQNSVIAPGTGGACGGDAIGAMTAAGNVASDATCQFKDPSNLNNTNPQLGALANNGGTTNTHALQPSSPAIGRATSCATIDQRGVTRVAPCDSGAYEYRPPTLRVVTSRVNDNGGTRTPSTISAHVLQGGKDVSGSPQAGTVDGTSYTLVAGAYQVAADAVAGYTLSITGDCAANGNVTLAEGQNRTCTITANDIPPPLRTQNLPPPVVGKNVNALPASGKVQYKLPGTSAYVQLAEGEQVPVGTIIDVLEGRVTLVASDGKGGTATADFYGGIFKLGQTKAGLTVLTLVVKLSCPKTGKKAGTAAKKKKKRRLWGDGSGRFQTKGKHSAATVVGTKWLVEDTCTTTLTKVVRGRVSVRDFVKRKTVLVKAGQKYIARAKKKR